MSDDDVSGAADVLRHKLWMVACHATGGGIPKIEGIDRSINDICVQISAHNNAIWKHAQEAALRDALNDLAVMMSEFVDNWPEPKKFSTGLALVAKTMRAALDPPKHDYWMPGEPDCPRDIKAPNGEIHTLRCKACGQDGPSDDRCSSPITQPGHRHDR